MNQGEATRYAHKLIATVIGMMAAEGTPATWQSSPDAPKIRKMLKRWEQLHARHGPMADDREPRLPEYTGERLPLDEPIEPLTAAETNGHDTPRAEVEPLATQHRDDVRLPDGAIVGSADHDDAHAVRVHDATRNAAGQIVRRAHTNEAGQHYFAPPLDDDTHELRLALADAGLETIEVAPPCSHRSLKADGMWKCIAPKDHDGRHVLEKEQRP
jgi:hypothetical protein